MLTRLKAQGAAYQKLDPAHPVALGIDLVVSVPDRFKGKDGTLQPPRRRDATIQQYVDFCKKNDLLLFLDLNIGWSDPLKELMSLRQVPEAAVRRGGDRPGVDVPAAQRHPRREPVERPGQRPESADQGGRRRCR